MSAAQTRFVRALEAEYERRAAHYRSAGLSPVEAHRRALEEAKQLGREALEELRHRGLFPWSGVGAEAALTQAAAAQEEATDVD